MQTKPLHVDVHEQIECAQTLASRFYTDPAILEIEKTRIFQRTQGELRAFSNVRGREL
jgi:hypothetical protein